MTETTVSAMIESGIEHDDDNYVKACALSDFLHYELRGLEMPVELSVKVTQIGTKRELRTISVETVSLRNELDDPQE